MKRFWYKSIRHSCMTFRPTMNALSALVCKAVFGINSTPHEVPHLQVFHLMLFLLGG